MINKECTINGCLICDFGSKKIVSDRISVRNIGGVACVRLHIPDTNVKEFVSPALKKKKSNGGFYFLFEENDFKNATIKDANRNDIMHLYEITDVSAGKEHELILKALSFKIVDDGGWESRWLIYKLQPTIDDIFGDMKHVFMDSKGNQYGWEDHEYFDGIKTIANELKKFKKNNVIKPGGEHNGERKNGGCWARK